MNTIGLFILGSGVGIVTLVLNVACYLRPEPEPSRTRWILDDGLEIPVYHEPPFDWLFVVTVAWDVLLALFLFRAALPLLQSKPDIWKLIPPIKFVPAFILGAIR